MHRASDIPRRLLAVAGLLLLAACSSDDAVAPATPTLAARPTLAAPPMPPAAVNPAVYVTGVAYTADSVFVNFTVTPSGGWFLVGYNAVYFPANAICEPTTSGYGVDTWDRPCTPATRNIQIKARAGRGLNDRGWVQFDTDLRFVPTADPARWVRIYMWSAEVDRPKPADWQWQESKFKIFWIPEGTRTLVDEAVADPTLQTQVLWGTGLVTRRLKHFSGYQVGNGYVSDDAARTSGALDY